MSPTHKRNLQNLSDVCSRVGEVASIPVGAEVEARELDKRDQYTHCACQVSSNSGIDSFTTSRVVGFNDYRWKLGLSMQNIEQHEVETYTKQMFERLSAASGALALLDIM